MRGPPRAGLVRGGPRWRRPRRLSRQVSLTFVITAVAAVVTFGALSFSAARTLLVTGTQEQLATVGATRAASVAAGANRVVSEVSVAASDTALAETVQEFSRQFAALEDQTLDESQQAELEEFYQQRVIEPLGSVGLGPVEVSDLLPRTAAGRWVQYQYTVRPAGEPASDDPGDGTGYSALNARFAPVARAFSDVKGGGDVLLVDDEATIVFSLNKANDVGTNLVTGPYADSALAEVVTVGLPRAQVGSTLITDFTVAPTGRAALYAVSPLTNGSSVVGGLALEIPVSAINAVTSSDGNWQGIGLRDGDAYIVNADGLLQSEPRAWVDDPSGYLEMLRDGSDEARATADIIELLGSPVGVQTLDTEPVRAAIDGEDFTGSTTSYTGDATFASARSTDVSGQQWVVVTEVPRSVVLDPLLTYVVQVGVVLMVVLPIVAVLGAWLSSVLARPIRPTVDAAESIVAGERTPKVDTGRGDEFADLARQLSEMASALASREADLAAEYERTRRLLLAVLPPSLVDADGTVAGSGARTMPVTVVAVTVAPVADHEDGEMLQGALLRAAEIAETLAEETGLERVRVAADRYLFLAPDEPGAPGAHHALAFTDELHRRLGHDGVDVELDLHVGLASGPVATGVLDTGALTFGAWGEPVRRALALAALAAQDDVLVDASTAQQVAGSRWRMEPAHDVVDLDDEPMDLYTLGLTTSDVGRGG